MLLFFQMPAKQVLKYKLSLKKPKKTLFLPPVMAHQGLQSVPHHVLVFSNEEASLCNHSQLLAQVLPGVI